MESCNSEVAAQQTPDGRWAEYAVKVTVLVVVLCLVSWFAAAVPPLCLAIAWAVLSMVSAVSVAYHFVINKARNRAGLEDGGIVARFNGGRVVSLAISFVVSAACIGGLILELPKWGMPEWAMVVVALPLYVGIYRLAEGRLSREYKPLLRVSRTVAVSSAALFAVLLLAYLAICLASPTAHYASMQEAFLAAKQPFADSPSVLLADAGYLGALVDGLTAFAMTRVTEQSLAAYVAWRVTLCCSTAMGLANLVGACSLKLSELKLVFRPLGAVDDPSADAPVLKRYVVVVCILPVLLFACAAAVDAKVAAMAETEGYTMVRAAIREQVGMAACVIDGKRYDYEKVEGLVEKARKLSDDLASEREAKLSPLINEVYDARLANVDSYLDWYYSLPADYDRLLQFFAGTVEDGMREQLADRINEGVDESGFDEALAYYLEESLKLESSIKDELADYELSDYGLGGVPDWLIVSVKPLEADAFEEPLAPTRKFLDASQRLGLSAGAGVVAGVIAAKATEKILAKPFFRKIVASLMEKLGARGLLAVGGTAIAPGAGTAIGIGVGFAGDYLFLKVDEAMNRDAYRDEIAAAIEEGRAEMLEMVKA